jgi:AcrR family transcriptional regulator
MILAAAARIVDARSAGHLTIDAVACDAAVSQGRALCYFPSKRALLEGMLERLLEQ